MAFTSVGDYIKFYKSDAFNIAYNQLDPFSCYVLAFGSSSVMGAIGALARPISSSDLVATTKKDMEPSQRELEYLNMVLEDPNPHPNPDLDGYCECNQTPEDFKFKLTIDYCATGNNFIEPAYNKSGFLAALYRHPPYMISVKKGRYVHKSGYVFKPGELIHNKYMNPFSNKIGMSPMVPIVAATMLDNSILTKNLKNYSHDSIKGILQIDPSLGNDAAEDEVKRIQKQIKEMKEKGDEGHLVTFGAAFQAIGSTNKEMLTPEMERGINTRIISVYGVPPHKVGRIESGNIGSGTGDSQSEDMNETLTFWSRAGLLGSLRKDLIKLTGVKSTTITLTNLTKQDIQKQAEVDNMNVRNGTATWNDIRESRGLPRYVDPMADEPFVPYNCIPLSSFNQGYDPKAPTGPGDTNNAKKAAEEMLDPTNQMLMANQRLHKEVLNAIKNAQN
jgi:HK97 family phage portal protein